jgi:hypothetical protein
MSNIIFCPVFNNLYCKYNVNILDDIYRLDNPIVYTHMDYINHLFNILKNVNKKIILITHNGDYNTPDIPIPECIIKWYSQNVTIKKDKVESIPIGIENDIWFPEIGKRNKIINKIKEPKQFKNLLYINHNINTNPKERQEPYDLFKNDWTTLKYYKNGEKFDEYVDDVYNHKFILCPNGNGIDTHRLWETLYLKSIPIVKKSINSLFYNDLPICFVDNWSEINKDFLNKQYDIILNKKWNLEKLNIEYWKNKITMNEKFNNW